MNTYKVSYEKRFGGKVIPIRTTVYASSKAAAKQRILNEYWDEVDGIMRVQRCTQAAAERLCHWPFNIKVRKENA